MTLLQDISFQTVSDLEFDLSMPFKVKPNDAVGLPIYDFLWFYCGRLNCTKVLLYCGATVGRFYCTEVCLSVERAVRRFACL